MATVKVNVAIAKDALDHFDEVVSHAQDAGLTVEQTLHRLGIVCGSIDVTRLAELDRVPGVAAVNQERTYHLPSPDSAEQ